MLELKKEEKEKLVSFVAKIPKIDKDILTTIGDGLQAEGLRMVLYTFRSELQEIADKKAIQKKNKSKKAS